MKIIKFFREFYIEDTKQYLTINFRHYYIEKSNNNGSTENKASKPANEPVANSCLVSEN